MDHKFFKPQRLGPKIFLVLPFLWTKNCFDQNCFFNSFLNPKIIFKPNNFWIQNYIGANIFGAKIVLDQIVFIAKFLTPNFSILNWSGPKQFFGPEIEILLNHFFYCIFFTLDYGIYLWADSLCFDLHLTTTKK